MKNKKDISDILQSNFGYYEGDLCNRKACNGKIFLRPSQNCSCHISPPCSSCTAPRNYCQLCGWEEHEDGLSNNISSKSDKKTSVNNLYCGPRKLNKSIIDWDVEGHTRFSMIKVGVCPVGTTIEQVYEVVKCTFGGRFESFGNGKFKFIGYTD